MINLTTEELNKYKQKLLTENLKLSDNEKAYIESKGKEGLWESYCRADSYIYRESLVVDSKIDPLDFTVIVHSDTISIFDVCNWSIRDMLNIAFKLLKQTKDMKRFPTLILIILSELMYDGIVVKDSRKIQKISAASKLIFEIIRKFDKPIERITFYTSQSYNLVNDVIIGRLCVLYQEEKIPELEEYYKKNILSIKKSWVRAFHKPYGSELYDKETYEKLGCYKIEKNYYENKMNIIDIFLQDSPERDSLMSSAYNLRNAIWKIKYNEDYADILAAFINDVAEHKRQNFTKNIIRAVKNILNEGDYAIVSSKLEGKAEQAALLIEFE